MADRQPHRIIDLGDLVRAREASRNAPIDERRAAAAEMLRDDDASRRIDLRPLMELSPHSVLHSMPLPRLHDMFVTLGLRHLYVTDTRNHIVGIVTRKDLLPEVLDANTTAAEPFVGGGGEGGGGGGGGGDGGALGSSMQSIAQRASQRIASATRRRRHEPKVPAHKLRSARHASLLRRALSGLGQLSPGRPLGAQGAVSEASSCVGTARYPTARYSSGGAASARPQPKPRLMRGASCGV